MTSGVYQLRFGAETYIGKSTNIERRWEEHLESMSLGKASKKLQSAYNRRGVPERIILFACHPDHIDLVETLMVDRFKPSLNSASTVFIAGPDVDTLWNSDSMLGLSTGEHLRTIDRQQKVIARITDELMELLDEDAIASEVVDSRLALAEAVVEIAQLRTKLEAKNRPWWKKLF